MEGGAAAHTTFDVRQPFAKSKQMPVDPASSNEISQNSTVKDDVGHHYQPNQFAELFEKHFKYQPPKDAPWQLPSSEELFSEYYQLENLQELKRHLNNVKSSLNDYGIEDWSAHTSRNDPAGQVQWVLKNEVRVEFATVAWCKFYECLKQYPLVKGPQLNSLHLCEAPGAFIAALNHYLYSSYNPNEVQWNWLSTTLNPYYEGNPLGKMIIDDRFILFTLDRWLFHKDFTGNIISRTNIENMQHECRRRLKGGVQLITADGSIDCVETPDSQEEYVSLLHFAEICAALSILSKGGCFVLKLFTLFEATTVCKMYLLNCVFEEVHVFKPATSKRGNSENYIICLGYKKQQLLPTLQATLQIMKSMLSEEVNVLPMFRKSHIPKDFLLQHESCARRFMNLQINAIQSNICSFELKSRTEERRNQIVRAQVSNEFIRRYNIKPLPEKLKILYNRQSNVPKLIKTFIYKGSYSERQCLKDTPMEEQIFMQRTVLNELERSLCGRHCVLLQETWRTNENKTLKLKLFHGATFKNLRSSLFASVQLLLMGQKLHELLGVDPLQQMKSKCMLFSSNSDERAATIIDISEVPSDFSEMQRYFILKILVCLIEHKPQKLIFSNYAFLMHLPVSFLRILSQNCFQKFTISTDRASESNFEVTLQHCVYDVAIVNILEKLLEVTQENTGILCMVDIVHLHCNEFCSALTEFNNLLLLNNYKALLMT